MRRCAYCDFVSYAGREDAMEAYVAALLSEMESVFWRFPALTVPTVYVGGGTPSSLPPGLIARVLGRARELFAIGPDAGDHRGGEPRNGERGS